MIYETRVCLHDFPGDEPGKIRMHGLAGNLHEPPLTVTVAVHRLDGAFVREETAHFVYLKTEQGVFHYRAMGGSAGP